MRESLEELAEFYNMCTSKASKASKLGFALPAGKGKVRESLEELAQFYNMCAKRKEKQRKQIPLKGKVCTSLPAFLVQKYKY